MKTISNHLRTGPRRQRGITTLLIALLLLGILSVITFLALQVGYFEQRTVGSENRARMVSQVADAALNHAAEFLKADPSAISRTWMATGTRRWELCDRNDTTWPCGAEPVADRRERLYRYYNGNADDAATPWLETNAFTTQAATGGVISVGGAEGAQFAPRYAVGALLCMVDTTDPINPICSTTVDSAVGWSGPVAVTLVSRSNIPGEDAAGGAKVTVGTFRTINGPPNVPIIASGNVGGLGSGEIVPNPNAGGFGVPLSVWSNQNVVISTGGAMQTCHRGEWLDNYASGGPTQYDGTTICRNCRCNGLAVERGLLSGKDLGNGGGSPQYEGIDLLDVDSNTGTLPDATYFPFEGLDDDTNAMDDSLFEYIFGQENAAESDSSLVDADGNSKDDGRDWLESNAKIVSDCSTLNANSTGLYYIPPNVSCNINAQVGKPSAPIALVIEGSVSLQAQSVFYGMVFVKRGIGAPASISVAGGVQIYGAMVSEGSVNTNGTPAYIYDELVLKNLANSPAFQRFGVLPGSWSDADTF
jgi:hypothetical protein